MLSRHERAVELEMLHKVAAEEKSYVQKLWTAGVARQPGSFVKIGIGLARRRMDLSKLSDRERLAAEQAVLTLQALDRAADAAPMGQGLAFLEAAIADKGFEHLRTMMSLAVNARDEAQKKGSASGDVPAETE